MGNKILISIFTGLSITSMCLVPLASCGAKPEEKIVDFTNDSWANVINYCNKGINELCNAYHHNADWFIGKKRKIKVNNIEQEVMVIGINHDITSSRGDDVTLTFQFNNILCWYNNKPLYCCWDSKAEPTLSTLCDYWHTEFENNLNGDIEGKEILWYDKDKHKLDEKRCVLEMIEPEVASNIKKVVKGVNTSDDEGQTWAPTKRGVKIFIPSLWSVYTVEQVYYSLGFNYDLREDYQYQYFVKIVGDKPTALYNYNLVKTYANTYVEDWALSTPCMGSQRGNIPYIASGGYASHNRTTIEVGSFAPCFCI